MYLLRLAPSIQTAIAASGQVGLKFLLFPELVALSVQIDKPFPIVSLPANTINSGVLR